MSVLPTLREHPPPSPCVVVSCGAASRRVCGRTLLSAARARPFSVLGRQRWHQGQQEVLQRRQRRRLQLEPVLPRKPLGTCICAFFSPLLDTGTPTNTKHEGRSVQCCAHTESTNEKCSHSTTAGHKIKEKSYREREGGWWVRLHTFAVLWTPGLSSGRCTRLSVRCRSR